MSGAQFTGGAARTGAGQSRTGRPASATHQAAVREPDQGNLHGSNGLSLRTRLLLLQIAVTAVFLLIMGIVSTALFAQHLRSQFHATILAESTRSPADIAQRPAQGVSAVEVTFSPFEVRPLTLPVSPAATRALAVAVRQLGPVKVIRRGKSDHWFPVPAVGLIDGLQAAARLIPPTENVPRRESVLIVAEQSTALTRQLRGLILIEMITGGGLVALLAIGGQWLIGRGLGPLDRMASTANDITARGDLTARMAEADDQTEVGRLGAAINTMLDRIQQAFGARLNSERKVREFAADASHELRTPLTTIRGYAELYRQGALGPEQLPGAMRRIEQEAQRMSTLVAELLELARLDRTSSLDLDGDRPRDRRARRRRRRDGGRAGSPDQRPGSAAADRRRRRTKDPAGPGQPARQRPRAHAAVGSGRGPARASSGRRADRDRRFRAWHVAGGRGTGVRPVPPRGRACKRFVRSRRGRPRHAGRRLLLGRRQRAWPVHRPGDRDRARRPGDPGVLAGPRHPRPHLAPRPRARPCRNLSPTPHGSESLRGQIARARPCRT